MRAMPEMICRHTTSMAKKARQQHLVLVPSYGQWPEVNSGRCRRSPTRKRILAPYLLLGNEVLFLVGLVILFLVGCAYTC